MAIIETRSPGGSYTELRYREWSATYGVSDVQVAPEATVETAARGEAADAGDELRIRDEAGSKTIFEGRIVSAPRKSQGNQTLKCEAARWRTFEENVSVTLTSPTVENVLTTALDATATASAADLTYNGPSLSLGNGYEETDRRVSRVFRDMAERVGVVWWVDSDGQITVGERGGRGTWASLNGPSDDFLVREYDPDDLDAVINVQTVKGTGEELVSATATDSVSITDFGRREGDPVNVGYITTATEAQDYADALLQPEPPAGAEVIVADGTGGATDDVLANYDLAVSDPDGTGMDDTLTIERQIIEEGRMTVDLGAARARGTVAVNRQSKSQEDLTSGGDVYDTERIVDLAIEETKISDEAVSTPKLRADAVTAEKIRVNTITAAQIATLQLATNELAVGSGLTARIEFDDIPISGTNETVAAMIPSEDNVCFIGLPGTRFSEMYATEMNTQDYAVNAELDDINSELASLDSRVSSLENSSGSG